MPRFHYLVDVLLALVSRSTLKALEALGAHIEVENGYVHATVDGRLKGGEVVLIWLLLVVPKIF